MTRTCAKCEKDLPVEQFGKAGKYLRSYCKSCYREYGKRYYKSATMVEYHRKWREENKNRLLAYLLSHPCVDCGEKDPVVLEFDHIDPTKKRYEVGYLVGRRSSWKQIQEEISLCDVVCANCHKRRTAKQQNWSKANPIKI